MDRRTRTIVQLLIIIVATIICGALAYFVSSAISGHGLATASGGMSYSKWQDRFFKIVLYTGGLTGLCTFVWFILSRKIFSISHAIGNGKRTVWAALALFSALLCITVPQVYSTTLGIKVNAIIILLFIVFFTLINYWLVSIFTTPLSFKYTPLGARLLLSRRK